MVCLSGLDAPLYEHHTSAQFQVISEALEKYKNWFNWESNEKILDIGCGPGNVSTFLLENYAPSDAILVGGDISEDVIRHASENHSHDRITYRVMNAQSPSLLREWEGEEFSKVFSFYSFIQCRNLSQALTNAYSLLKPGGQFFVIQPCNGLYTPILQDLAKTDKWGEYYKDIFDNLFPLLESKKFDDDFDSMLQEAGFIDISSEIWKRQYTYKNFDVYWNGFDAVNLFGRRVPQEQKEEHRSDIRGLVEGRPECTIEDEKLTLDHLNCISMARKPE